MPNFPVTLNSPHVLLWLKLLGVSLAYAALSKISLTYFSGDGSVSFFWPPAGMGLAAVLLGGKRYALSVFLGATLADSTNPHFSLAAATGAGIAKALEALFGGWLIWSRDEFSNRLAYLRDYFHLMFLGAFGGAAIGAILSAAMLWAAGISNGASLAGYALHWWMGDALGIVMLTPMLLVWRQFPPMSMPLVRLAECLLAFLLAFVGGQIIYFGWFSAPNGAIAGNYWMLLIVAWIAVRFGLHGVVLVLLMTTVQGVLGSYHGVGMFANDNIQAQQVNFCSFLLLLSMAGVSLAVHFSEHDQLRGELRSAKKQQDALLDAVPDLLFEIGLDGQLHQIYTHHPELLPAPADVLLGSRVQDRWPGEAAAVVMVALQQANRDGFSAGHQFSLSLKQGITWFEISVSGMATDNHATDPHFIMLSRDITARKLAEQDLRIAAIAFESQEGMLVASAQHIVLRVNQAFTQITGFAAQEIVGSPATLVRPEVNDEDLYAKAFDAVHRTGRWQGESWIRRKNGELVAVWGTLTAVRDEYQQVSHFVRTLTDITRLKLQEQHRLKVEVQLRETLVREVHHRIKNNLQGVTGVLRQHSQKYPETSGPIKQAIAQVQSIAAIHGLQGRNVSGEVLLQELLCAVGVEVQSIWHTVIAVDIGVDFGDCLVPQTEAVPLALVLNELLTNAVKHGGSDPAVRVRLQPLLAASGQNQGVVISVVNTFLDDRQFSVDAQRTDVQSGNSSGLELVAALLPRHGALLHQRVVGQQFVTLLELTSPAIARRNHD